MTVGWVFMGQSQHLLATVLVAAAFVLCPHVRLFAGIELSGRSDITIAEEGPFDSAKGALSDLLEKYLLLALGKASLSGSGEEVAFIVRTNASYWHELPRNTIKHISDIDAFDIAISGSPQAVVTITGWTPLAAGYGVMFFLEKHMEILWAFPGELGLCLPKKQIFSLKDGNERVAPWIIARSLSLRYSVVYEC